MTTAPLTARDLHAPASVWMLWHGGHSYAPGYVSDHLELVESGELVGIMLDRLANRDGSTPAVDESSEAFVYFRDASDESDPYPDARVVWSGYHNRFVWDYT